MTFIAHVEFSISMTSSGRWFSRGPPVSTTNKTDLHDITEILLKVTLNTIKQKTNKQTNKQTNNDIMILSLEGFRNGLKCQK
jgi:hypothetical protein